MYQPKKYQKTDTDYIYRFILQHPFASLVLQGKRLMGTHVPVLTEGTAAKFRLFAHLANHNEQTQFLKDGLEVLLIFQGAHAYVSSSWYKEKDISTWDYSAVHINARLRIQSPDELEKSLEELVRHFEAKQANPLYYQDIPKTMLDEHLPQITGFWCEPFKIEAIAKWHQGYGKDDIDSITRHWEEQKHPSASGLSQMIKKEHDTDH